MSSLNIFSYLKIHQKVSKKLIEITIFAYRRNISTPIKFCHASAISRSQQIQSAAKLFEHLEVSRVKKLISNAIL